MTDDSEGTRQSDGEDAKTMELEHALRNLVAEADPAPATLVQHATEAFTLRNLDEELIELVRDSWLDVGAVTRALHGTRMLTFESVRHPEIRIEVGVTRTVGGYEVIGQVVPPAAGEVRVIYRGGRVSRPVDDYGRFDADLPEVTSIRLWFRSDAAATEAPIVTQWVPIG
jgi:hypothetical protein